MGTASRVLGMAAVAGAALAFLAVVALFGYGRGWHLERVPAAELSARLRPHDEIVLPPGEGPFPTVIQFHGCGGKRRNQSQWAERLRDAGFAAVVVDSFASRGVTAGEVCTGRALLPVERSADVLVTLDHVRGLPFVDPDRIVLAGWSHGGVTLLTLMAMNPPDELPPSLDAGSPIGLDGVAGVVLFYPYCGVGSRAGVWASEVPSLFLVAGADQTAPPGPCIELAEALRDAGRPTQLEVYPDAGHAFDHEDYAGDSPLAVATTAAAEQHLLGFLSRIAKGRGGF